MKIFAIKLRRSAADFEKIVQGPNKLLQNALLDDEHFAMMSKNYTEEQKDFKAEVKNLQQKIEEQERQAENFEQIGTVTSQN